MRAVSASFGRRPLRRGDVDPLPFGQDAKTLKS